MDRQLNPSSGYSVTRLNVGELQNTGVEFSLNGSLIQSKDLSFDLGLNWSTNQNENVALTGKHKLTPIQGKHTLLILLIHL